MMKDLEREPSDSQKVVKRKDRVTISDDDQCFITDKQSTSGETTNSARLTPAAAICTMETPSIKDVLSSSPIHIALTNFGRPSPTYFDIRPLTVSKKRWSKSSDRNRRGSVLPRFDHLQEDDALEQHSRPDDAEDSNETGSKKKIVISLIIVVVMAISWTGSTQLAKSSLTSSTFRAPFFLIWFNTSWMAVCFPFYVLLVAIVLAFFRKKPLHTKSPYRVICDASSVFGPSGLTAKAIITRSVPFTALWIIISYSFSQALVHITAAETTAVYSSNAAFVYLLSWIFFHDAFVALRVLALLLAIIGIVTTVHAEGIGNIGFVGVVCAVIAAAVSAIYKVLLKKFVGETNFGQMSLFMTMLGLCNLLLSWPLTLALVASGAETIVWNDVPWPFICASAGLNLLFNLFVNVGLAYTHPAYVSVGLFLGMPLNAAADALWRENSLEHQGVLIIGGICILISFFLLMLPENITTICLRWLGISRQSRNDVFIVTR